jgi:glutamate dehydrogenase
MSQTIDPKTLPAPPASPQRKFLEALVDALRESIADPERRRRVEEFARAFHFRTPLAYFERRELADLARELLDAFDFVDGRTEPFRVRIFDCSGCRRTLLQVNMDDQPFILDTVLETCRALGVRVESYLHPILQTDRDGGRRLTAVRPRTAPGHHESYLHLHLDALGDGAPRARLEKEIREALVDAKRAVEDFAAMKQRVQGLAREILTFPPRDAAERLDIEETAAFLEWLLQENFVFLGVRSYRFAGAGGEDVVELVKGSGLGILRDESTSNFARPVPVSKLDAELRGRLRLRSFPLVGKTNRSSRVHRRTSMEYIGIKVVGAGGAIAGEHRILGLFSAAALNRIAADIPVLRRKLEGVLQRAQVLEGSYEYKAIVGVFNSTPKAELFSKSIDQIASAIEEVVALQSENEVRVACQEDLLGQRVSVMVVMPRERFNSAVRERIQATLTQRFKAPSSDYRLALSDEPYARLHFYFPIRAGRAELPGAGELQSAVAQAIRTWDDDFKDLMRSRHGVPGDDLGRKYAACFSEIYRASIPPEIAVLDVDFLEKALASGGIEIAIEAVREKDAAGAEATTLRLYRPGRKFLLSDIMPVLTNMGLVVIDESTFRFESDRVPLCHLHVFRIQKRGGEAVPAARWEDLRLAVDAVLEGRYENDVLNELVVTCGLAIRQVELLRAASHYYHQLGSPHDKGSVVSALSTHPELTALVVEYFRVKFRPDASAPPPQRRLEGPLKELGQRIAERIDAIADINEDRIFRKLFGLVQAALRTNYFQKGGALPYVSFKVRSEAVPGMPRPAPLFEIFVHSVEVEGVHLRSGLVARGGIRWSDRRDDFRTEILGLMRTQVTKNAIIVPVGSKGGFVLKRPPEDRKDLPAEVERQYRTFIRGLLDLTDNRIGDEVRHPTDTVVYDGPDPYLVVAADKGTAAFSDVGNAIAREYGFWLNDAFASGGSNGYDHKKHGITARGAWECVRWHFKELGLDIDAKPFTVVGIGDMSGDVFGNGMLLSRKIRLLAAFDHRHVFLDPDPDPERSFAERRRLFELPRSSWADYRPELISAGGGVFPRSTKRIRLSSAARAALGVAAESLSGDELIQAVLKTPADLLYNGGIGTYVKAGHESHADVRDERNDAVRVDAKDLRCRIVSEGGNLGFTPAARVEFARHGGRINADFIDNSGGVDLSDHEVNLKIALGRLIQKGKLDLERRNRLLERLAPEVCALVLATNRSQAKTLSSAEQASKESPFDFQELVEDLKDSGILDPALDRFPDAPEIARRRESGLGFLRPELATLLAFSKIEVTRTLEASDAVDGAGFEDYLTSYFPPAAVELAGPHLVEHPLRRAIIATVFTNEIGHRMGMTYASRLRRALGVETLESLKAYRVADRLLAGASLFDAIESLVDAGSLAPASRALAIGHYRAAVNEIARSLARSWPRAPSGERLAVDAVIARLAPHFAAAAGWLGTDSFRRLRAGISARGDELQAAGLPADLAARLALFEIQSQIPGLAPLAARHRRDLAGLACALLSLQEALRIPALLRLLEAAPAARPEERSAHRALCEEVRQLAFRLTRGLASNTPPGRAVEEAVGEFLYDHCAAVESYLEAVEAARSPAGRGLASFVVLVERLKRLAGEET